MKPRGKWGGGNDWPLVFVASPPGFVGFVGGFVGERARSPTKPPATQANYTKARCIVID